MMGFELVFKVSAGPAVLANSINPIAGRGHTKQMVPWNSVTKFDKNVESLYQFLRVYLNFVKYLPNFLTYFDKFDELLGKFSLLQMANYWINN